jgi:hypothetical protein
MGLLTGPTACSCTPRLHPYSRTHATDGPARNLTSRRRPTHEQRVCPV